jgi:hypothetical protein
MKILVLTNQYITGLFVPKGKNDHNSSRAGSFDTAAMGGNNFIL